MSTRSTKWNDEDLQRMSLSLCTPLITPEVVDYLDSVNRDLNTRTSESMPKRLFGVLVNLFTKKEK